MSVRIKVGLQGACPRSEQSGLLEVIACFAALARVHHGDAGAMRLLKVPALRCERPSDGESGATSSFAATSCWAVRYSLASTRSLQNRILRISSRTAST